MAEKAAAWNAKIEDVLRAAHDAAFRTTDLELTNSLSRRLGRLTVARLTGAPDENTISRWAHGRHSAAETRLDRMRHAAYLLNALIGLGFSESSAKQWFRSAHPALEDEKPMDVIARGDFKLALSAVRQHSPEARHRVMSTVPVPIADAVRLYGDDLA